MSLTIASAGMVTSVGLSAPATCAAIRARISRAKETQFTFDGEWLVGCAAPLDEGWRGPERLLRMVVPPVDECMAAIPDHERAAVPLLLCLPESDRPGRFASLDGAVLHGVLSRAARRDLLRADMTGVIAEGRVSGALALAEAARLLDAGHRRCVVAGVDTLLVAKTLGHFHQRGRLKTEANSNGFIPGEAGAAVLVTRGDGDLECCGVGFGFEEATIDSEHPLRADGMVGAIREAFASGGTSFADVDYRISDLSGEHYRFKEVALAMTRAMRVRKETLDLWHPAECVGEVGAASGPLALGVALAAAQKGYAPGVGVLCHFSNDNPRRAAIVLRARTNGRR